MSYQNNGRSAFKWGVTAVIVSALLGLGCLGVAIWGFVSLVLHFT